MANAPDWNQAPRVPERGPTDAAGFAEEVQAAGTPVVLRGQVADWPLVEAGRGSSEAFSQALLAGSPGGKVHYFEGAESMGGRFFYSDDLQGFNFERRETPFADFLAQLCALEQGGPARHLYAGAIRVPETAPALLARYPLTIERPSLSR